MKLKEIVAFDPSTELKLAGVGRSCEYCPSEAQEHVGDHYVCDQHIETAKRDWEDNKTRKRKARIAGSETNEQPDVIDEDEDDEEELKANLPEAESTEALEGTFRYQGELFRADAEGVWWFDARQGMFLPYHLWEKKGSIIGVQKDLGSDHPKRAAGILFVCQGRVLLVKRAHDENNPGVWSVPGGHVKLAHDGMPQDVWGNAKREVQEEMGGLPPGIGRATRKHRAISKSGKTYTTYIVELPPGAMKWRPQLNPEHVAYRWCNRKQTKALKLHPNVARVLKNQDIWDGRFFTRVTLQLERDASLGQIMQEGKLQIETINAAAQQVYSDMGKDFRYIRLEMTTVVHGPPGYIPVAGVGGVLRKGSSELFWQASISPKNGNLRVYLTTRKTGFKKGATFRSSQGISRWITQRLTEHFEAVSPY